MNHSIIEEVVQHQNETIIKEKDLTSAAVQQHEEEEVSTVHGGENKRRRRLGLLLNKWWSNIMGDIYAVDDPNNFSPLKKNIIIFIVAYGGLMGPTAAMIYLPGIQDVMNDLNTSVAGINASVAAYVVFLGISVSCDTHLFTCFFF
jgi:hypothetical protein